MNRKLVTLENKWKNCKACPLGCVAFKHVIFDVPDNSRVQVLFIGEGPGRSEDMIGLPFKGKAGKFLREVIAENNPLEATFGFSNLVACRPRTEKNANRPPQESEIAACRQRLISLINILEPEEIVGLGRVPQTHLPRIIRDSKFKGKQTYFYHPSWVIRQGGKKAGQVYTDYAEGFLNLFARVMIGGD